MYFYKLSLEAEEDITRIYQFGYYKFGLQQADKYYNMLFECFDKIASNPFMFPEAYAIKENFRSCVCGVNSIYYKIGKNNKIEIITIIGKQDFSS